MRKDGVFTPCMKGSQGVGTRCKTWRSYAMTTKNMDDIIDRISVTVLDR